MRRERELYKNEDLKLYVNSNGLSQRDIILIALGSEGCCPKNVTDVKKSLVEAGQRKASVWPISTRLNTAVDMAIKTVGGWELTNQGKEHIQNLGVPLKSEAVIKVSMDLRNLVETSIKDSVTKEFVLEAVGCFEASHYRAAVLLSWVGALNLLYEHVCSQRLNDFNVEAKRRDAKWKDATTIDDLARLKEYDFLQIASATSMFGKSVKNELEQRLKLRNGCGHPNSLALGENAVANHLEILILNVFKKF